MAFTNFVTQLDQDYIVEDIVNTKWNSFRESDKNFFVCSYNPAAPPTFAPPTISTTQEVPVTRYLYNIFNQT